MTRPLKNRTILITRARNQAPDFRRRLEQQGARVLEFPTIEIRSRPDPELDQAVNGLDHCDWLMFTSNNAVEIFMERARVLARLPENNPTATLPKVCAIGPATAEKMESYGYSVDLVPRLYQAEGVLEDFLDFNKGQLKDLRILLPCASEARELLPQTLRDQGAEVNLVSIYDTVIPEERYSQLAQLFKTDAPDMITFTSSSTVKNFVALAEGIKEIQKYPCAVIGPITAETAAENALNIVVHPEESTLTELVAAMGRYFEAL
jgi:uroporphyrinogen III methyltransferase/synthase